MWLIRLGYCVRLQRRRQRENWSITSAESLDLVRCENLLWLFRRIDWGVLLKPLREAGPYHSSSRLSRVARFVQCRRNCWRRSLSRSTCPPYSDPLHCSWCLPRLKEYSRISMEVASDLSERSRWNRENQEKFWGKKNQVSDSLFPSVPSPAHLLHIPRKEQKIELWHFNYNNESRNYSVENTR